MEITYYIEDGYAGKRPKYVKLKQMNKVQILEKHLGAPIPLVGDERATRNIELAMDEFAKQQAIDFALNYAKSFHDDAYVKPTESELERMSFRYDKFIKVQSENK